MNAKLKKSILVISLLCFATQAWAVRAKIRFLFPVSTKSVTDGFEDSELDIRIRAGFFDADFPEHPVGFRIFIF